MNSVLFFYILSTHIGLTMHHESCFFVASSRRTAQELYHPNTTAIGCPHKHICNRTFTAAYMLGLEGYYVRMQPIQTILGRCCGSCQRIKDIRYYHDISEIPPHNSASSVDFIYPILAKEKTIRMFGYYFLPYYDVPGALYITKKPEVTLMTLLNIWPLILIVFLMSTVAGFIGWILETRRNQEEFRRPFLVGWFDGFWFCFVSMTTVGYGDKSPKSVTGRLFAVIWIFIGLVVCGMITGWIISDLWELAKPPEPGMKGKRVGIYKGHDYESYIIAKHGGLSQEFEGTLKELSTMVSLIKKLRSGDLDGLLFDRYNLWYLNEKLIDEKNKTARLENKDDLAFFLKGTERTVKTISEPKLVYGMLTKHKEHYDYLIDYMRDNQFMRENEAATYWAKQLNNKSHWEDKSFYTPKDILFSSRGRPFQYSVIVLTVLFFLVCFFGIIYELRRKKMCDVLCATF